MATSHHENALYLRLAQAPLSTGDPRGEAMLADVAAGATTKEQQELLDRPAVRVLLLGLLEASPYLSGLVRRDPARCLDLLACEPEARLRSCIAAAEALSRTATTLPDLMSGLRALKSEAALLIALCDLGGVWPLLQVTGGLTGIADAAVQAGVRYLFARARAKGDWTGGSDDAPDAGSGFIVLGMGKYGAGELNYSSDIDLIVFYEPRAASLRAGVEPQSFFVRLTRDLVKILQERTGDGYVFRVDLRLRPDPGATQVALSTDAALLYYESVGQNWERAAMIKARAVAGDIVAGRSFLSELAPFVWRKYLDFAAIADIHAMKRQINAHRGFKVIGVAGHNLKLGRGGIREIEFFVQTQQLIAGGRQTDLRLPTTLDALRRLKERQWIEPQVEADLCDAYTYLRGLEHRLQMIADEQTHTLPQGTDELSAFARFAGYPDIAALSEALLQVLATVQGHYAVLFEDSPELSRQGHNMMFAGETDDPATLETLSRLGYSQPSQVLATIRGWHHGRAAAVRTARARELLTEVQPLLVEALAATANPDAAFASFDRFLLELPSGVQLFSLLKANPRLMRLVADIMGTAPRLATILSRRRRLLDAVLDPRVMGTLPSREDISELIATELSDAVDLQEILDRARVVGSEQSFLVGVRVLTGMISADQAGGAYARLAEELIAGVQSAVEAEFAIQHGNIAGGAAAIVAMGKLGGREMTASSDLDLIVVYDFQDSDDGSIVMSDGQRPLPVTQYYARLTQRIISGLSAPTAEGLLYEVDMRLRPSGQQGPVATRLSSFVEYQSKEAWTWEHLALTRARVLTGPPALRTAVAGAMATVLRHRRDRSSIAAEVRDMRERIAREKGTSNIWDLKQVRGGLVDLEFMAQYLQLVHAADHPEVLDQNTVAALTKLERAGLLAATDAALLVPAARLIGDLTQLLRLCLDTGFEPGSAPEGLKALLMRAADAPSFDRLEADLRATLAEVASSFDRIVT